MPETYREVLVLHYFGGMTIKDIAGAIGGAREVGKGYSIWPVVEYDPARDVWTEKSKTPIAVSIPYSNAVNGKIYVMGGLITR
jgi:hypothetical protein